MSVSIPVLSLVLMLVVVKVVVSVSVVVLVVAISLFLSFSFFTVLAMLNSFTNGINSFCREPIYDFLTSSIAFDARLFNLLLQLPLLLLLSLSLSSLPSSFLVDEAQKKYVENIDKIPFINQYIPTTSLKNIKYGFNKLNNRGISGSIGGYIGSNVGGYIYDLFNEYEYENEFKMDL